MTMKDNKTFYCNFTGCKKYARTEGNVAWMSLSYRMIDGSAGITDNHYCEGHEPQVIEALRATGLLPVPEAT